MAEREYPKHTDHISRGAGNIGYAGLCRRVSQSESNRILGIKRELGWLEERNEGERFDTVVAGRKQPRLLSKMAVLTETCHIPLCKRRL